jgi:glutathione S-transferase
MLEYAPALSDSKARMQLELVSFKLCPFVQRSVITLLHKGVAFDIQYIELDDPPDWFLEISPAGRVPVLRVDDREVLFESAIINEFIDDVTPGSMRPDDPLVLARNRGWIAFGETCLFDQHRVILAADEDAYDEGVESMLRNLKKLEAALDPGPYFNGETLSLVDCAYAPLWMRYAWLNQRHRLFTAEDFPNIARWGDALVELPEVKASVVPDFYRLLSEFIRKKGPYSAQLFADTA